MRRGGEEGVSPRGGCLRREGRARRVVVGAREQVAVLDPRVGDEVEAARVLLLAVEDEDAVHHLARVVEQEDDRALGDLLHHRHVLPRQACSV